MPAERRGPGADAGSEAGDGLPFSGALAIPPAVLGALLIAGGLLLRRQTIAAGMAARAG